MPGFTKAELEKDPELTNTTGVARSEEPIPMINQSNQVASAGFGSAGAGASQVLGNTGVGGGGPAPSPYGSGTFTSGGHARVNWNNGKQAFGIIRTFGRGNSLLEAKANRIPILGTPARFISQIGGFSTLMHQYNAGKITGAHVSTWVNTKRNWLDNTLTREWYNSIFTGIHKQRQINNAAIAQQNAYQARQQQLYRQYQQQMQRGNMLHYLHQQGLNYGINPDGSMGTISAPPKRDPWKQFGMTPPQAGSPFAPPNVTERQMPTEIEGYSTSRADSDSSQLTFNKIVDSRVESQDTPWPGGDPNGDDPYLIPDITPEEFENIDDYLQDQPALASTSTSVLDKLLDQINANEKEKQKKLTDQDKRRLLRGKPSDNPKSIEERRRALDDNLDPDDTYGKQKEKKGFLNKFKDLFTANEDEEIDPIV